MITNFALRQAMRDIAAKKGPFTLFAKIRRADAPGTWDLVVSAPWLEPGQLKATSELVELLSDSVGENSLHEFSRIQTVGADDSAAWWTERNPQSSAAVTCRNMMATPTILAPDHEADPPGRRMLAATFFGWALGLGLAIGAVVVADSVGFRATQFPLALGMGAGVGLLQGRALSRYLHGRGTWLAATALGLAAPFIAADTSNLVGRPLPYSLAGYVGLGGAVVGILQWRLLRRSFRRAAWWLLASPPAWLLAGSTVWINERLLPKTPGLIGAVQYLSVVLAGGLVLSAVSAAALHAARGRGRLGRVSSPAS